MAVKFQRLHVGLNDLLRVRLAVIADAHADRALLRRVHGIGIAEGRVAQAEAERIQRLSLEIAVGAPLHAIIGERRKLLRVVIEGNRQTSRRADLSKQDVGRGRAARLTRVPDLQNGVAVLHVQRAAAGQKHHHGLAGGDDRVQQSALACGQLQRFLVAGGICVAGVALLALDRGIQTQHENRRVAHLGGLHGFGDAIVRRGQRFAVLPVQMRTLGVVHAHVRLAARGADALQIRDIAG